jgi:TP901 family phage tail tape measure protein
MARKRTSVIQVMIAGDASDLNKATQSGSKGMGLLGAAAVTAAKIVTSALSGIAAFSIREFARFDQAMTQSQAIMGDLSDSTKKAMSDVAREVGVTTTFAAHEAADAFYFLASAGLTAEQSIAALPRMALFAQAGMFDLARATDILTDAQSALGMSSDDAAENLAAMTELSNVMVGIASKANATVEQFGEAFMRAGARIRMVGVPINEAAAVLGAFAEQGTKGAAGGEAFSIILRDLPRAADKNAKAFRDLGISVENADGTFRPMADIIEDFENALDGLSSTQQAGVFTTLGLTRSVADQLATLVGTSGKIREYESALEGMGDITQEVADKQLASFSNQLALTRSQFTDIGLTIGEALAGPLAGFNLWLRDQAPAISDFVDKAVPKFETFVDKARTKFAEYKSVFDENLREPLGGLLTRLQELGGEGLTALSGFVDRARTFLLDFATAVAEGDSEAAGQALGEAISDLLKMAFEMGGDATEMAVAWARSQDWVAIGVAVGKETYGFGKGLFRGLFSAVDDETGEINYDFSAFMRLLAAGLILRIPVFRGALSARTGLFALPIVGTISAALGRAVLLLTPGLGRFSSTLGGLLAGRLGTMVAGTRFAGVFSNIGLTMQRLFAGEFASLPARLGASIGGMFSGLGGTLLRQARLLPTHIRVGIISGLPGLVAWFQTGGLVTLLKGFGVLLAGLVAAIGGWPLALFAAAVAAFVTFISRFKKWNENEESEYEGWGGSIVGFIVQGVKKFPFYEAFKNWFLERVEDIKTILFPGETKTFEDLGKSMIRGFIAGVNLMSGGLVSAVTDAVKDAYNAAKEWLKSRSPSKKFAELGDAMGEGMSKGLRDTFSMLSLSGSLAAQQAFRGAEGALRVPEVPSMVRPSGGDTYVINVSGALDAEGVARQIEKILRDSQRRTGGVFV